MSEVEGSNKVPENAEDKNGTIGLSIHEAKVNLSEFQMTKVLQKDALKKLIFIQGTFKDRQEPAIVILEKSNFPEDDVLQTSLFNNETEIDKRTHNDIYGNYECFPGKLCSAIKTVIIHPATQKHIDKYTPKPRCIVDETYELYKNVTLPYIESQQFSLTWVDNILNHTAEADTILYEDPDEESGFIMLPDLKWDGALQSLHIVVFARKKLKSLRDLDGSHLNMLRKIKENGSKAIQEKYKVLPSQLRMYLHYQPTFYHLHIHCTYLMQEMSPGINTERAHMLTNVINNLETDPQYYQKATLPFVVYQNDPLFKKYQEIGILPSNDVLNSSEIK